MGRKWISRGSQYAIGALNDILHGCLDKCSLVTFEPNQVGDAISELPAAHIMGNAYACEVIGEYEILAKEGLFWTRYRLPKKSVGINSSLRKIFFDASKSRRQVIESLVREEFMASGEAGNERVQIVPYQTAVN